MTNDDDIVAEVLRRALCSKLNHNIQSVADSAATALRLKAEGWTKPVPKTDRAREIVKVCLAAYEKHIETRGDPLCEAASAIRPLLGPEVDADGWIETPYGFDYAYEHGDWQINSQARKINIIGPNRDYDLGETK